MRIAEVEVDGAEVEPESMVGAKALALAMCCSIQLVRRMARAGTIPSYRFGTGMRFRISEVSRFCWCGGNRPAAE